MPIVSCHEPAHVSWTSCFWNTCMLASLMWCANLGALDVRDCRVTTRKHDRAADKECLACSVPGALAVFLMVRQGGAA